MAAAEILIYKRPANIVFSTWKIYEQYPYKVNESALLPLDKSHELRNYDYLRNIFPLDHPIFDDYINSYYYKLNDNYKICPYCNALTAQRIEDCYKNPK